MLISNSAVGSWTITRRAAKLKPPAVKQKSFELEREDFSKPAGKGDRWTILLSVGGKNRAADLNFGEKTAFQSRSFETAVSSLDFVYRKLRQTPENPPKTTK